MGGGGGEGRYMIRRGKQRGKMRRGGRHTFEGKRCALSWGVIERRGEA